MRLIDAENVAKSLNAMKERLGCNAIMIDAMVEGLLNQEQTIDAVPVVHCKECRHYIRWCGKNICNCRYYFDGSGIELREEDYCSRGVKRDE